MFAGTPAPAVPSLEALLASEHEVLAVLTRPDAPAGRGRTLSRSPIAERADTAGIPVLQPRSPREPEFQAQLAELGVDCVPVVAYGALIPVPALEIPRHGWVNLHFSLLPAWRGAAPVQHAIMAGDDVTGASTFLIEQGLDTGPVYGTLTEAIGPRDTAGDLLARLAVSGAQLLVATLDGIAAGALEPQPQPAEGVSLAPRIEVADARIDWALPAHVVDRRVRGVTPAPGAWTTWRGDRLRVGPVEPVADAALAPGELAIGKQVLVGTASGAVRLGEVQPAGKRMLPAADWARGARPAAGERLE
ncbi:methionyl-tRNA formyltransferase [Petropleomorpha daqingensis]|uniref:Methionyl-tRNA formyltransferase n=1 Tax=Petropleomorpha daqingensis TaxID=2026353 RepID=A0A853CK20_9ACTN|nr:methionyl-tRNA formyltransferase [Petropleomorpha daqingensis]